MQRSRMFSQIGRHWRTAVACGQVAIASTARAMFGPVASDDDQPKRSPVVVSWTPHQRVRRDLAYALWRIEQQRLAMGKALTELESHRRDCANFSAAIGDDMKMAMAEIKSLMEERVMWESKRAAQNECHNALADEVEELRTRLGEMEDRFACRTNFLGNPSQN